MANALAYPYSVAVRRPPKRKPRISRGATAYREKKARIQHATAYRYGKQRIIGTFATAPRLRL